MVMRLWLSLVWLSVHAMHAWCLDDSAGTLGRGLGGDQPLVLEVFDNLGDGARDVDLVRPDVDLGLGGSLVRRRDTRELCRQRRPTTIAGNRDAPLISPLRALAYRPLGSRCSTTLRGAST